MGQTISSLSQRDATIIGTSGVIVAFASYRVAKWIKKPCVDEISTAKHIVTELRKSGSDISVTTASLSSRFFPVAGVVCWWVTFLGSLCSSLYHGHDRNGLVWPYISDCAKHSPERAFFSFGSTVTSMFMSTVCVLNYGKVLFDMRNHPESARCRKRNFAAAVSGAVGSPFLGLLACFDVKDNPRMHLVCVLVFFPLILVWMYATLSVYEKMLALRRAAHADTASPTGASPRTSLRVATLEAAEERDLERSVTYKRAVATLMAVSVTVYLPVGMCLVSDWFDYAKDFAVHQCRAVAQHVAVACIVAYFGSFYFDFGSLGTRIVTYEDPRASVPPTPTEAAGEPKPAVTAQPSD
eukprot:TRINITY_DN47252_c0_g1_i1.p1 TRINITY_DN47252_c0_g1~~TRINITY_DN47252_c0_g1_i1.p1  ORF type:complete len:353 (+),score=55.62 TRINITY_DN47252_c0_g1_i1:117-1175(+)